MNYEAKRLNIGSGKVPLRGYVNADLNGGEVLADICRLPFKDGSFDFVLASQVLEHIREIAPAMKEVHRVLKHGGIFRIHVPYGLRGLYDAYHVRPFNLQTLEGFYTEHPSSYEYAALYRLVEARILSYVFPLAYHVEKYLPWVFRFFMRIGVFDPPDRPGKMFGFNLPLGPRAEILFLLEKV